MESLLGLVFVAVLVWGIVRLTARRGRSRRRFKCHDCQHLRRSFDDGVLCGFGAREVFKTRAHIAMCPDWEERRRQ